MKLKNKILVETSSTQIVQMESRARTILADVNSINRLAKTFGDNVPKDASKVINFVDDILQDKIKGANLAPLEIAKLLGYESEYRTLVELVEVTLNNPSYKRYNKFIRFDEKKNKYSFHKSCDEYIIEQCSIYLHTSQEAELYQMALQLLELYNKQATLIGKDDPRDRKIFGNSNLLVKTDNFSFDLGVNVSNIKKYAKK